jgi:hypothetical protein
MHRTTILLPQDLHRDAEKEASRLGISVSELIRRQLATLRSCTSEDHPAFFRRKPWVDDGAIDVAAEHDRYLYES